MKSIDVYCQRIENEILKVCDHPNIIKLIDIFESIECSFIVLEYLEGFDLYKYLKKRSYTISEERGKQIIF